MSQKTQPPPQGDRLFARGLARMKSPCVSCDQMQTGLDLQVHLPGFAHSHGEATRGTKVARRETTLVVENHRIGGLLKCAHRLDKRDQDSNRCTRGPSRHGAGMGSPACDRIPPRLASRQNDANSCQACQEEETRGNDLVQHPKQPCLEGSAGFFCCARCPCAL